MKYVIPWISNDYCVKRNIKGTHMKRNMKCVEGDDDNDDDASPSHMYLFFPFKPWM